MALRDALLNGLDGLCGYPRSAAFRVVERLAAAGALDEPSVFVHAVGDGNDTDAKVWTSGVGGEVVPDEVKEAFAHFYKHLARGYRLKRGLRETVDGRLSDLLEIEKKKGKKGETEETVQDMACQSTTWTPRMRSATWKRALARSSAVDLRGIEEKKFVALLPRFQCPRGDGGASSPRNREGGEPGGGVEGIGRGITAENLEDQSSDCRGARALASPALWRVVARGADRCGEFLDRTSIGRASSIFPAVFDYRAGLVRGTCGNSTD